MTMENKETKRYPYLGRNYVNGKAYVVLFNEPDMGMVVMNDTDNPKLNFATYGSFDENVFEILPPNECVRISN